MRINLPNHFTNFSLRLLHGLPSFQILFAGLVAIESARVIPIAFYTTVISRKIKPRACFDTVPYYASIMTRLKYPEVFVSEKETRQVLHGAPRFRCRSNWYIVIQRLRNSTARIKESRSICRQ